MRTILIAILFVLSTLAFSQNEKTLKYINSITTTANLKITTQTPNYVKAEFLPKHNYSLENIMTICDTTIKSRAVYDWRINGDRNDEKEYVVDGRKLLITIYWKDEFIYFEY